MSDSVISMFSGAALSRLSIGSTFMARMLWTRPLAVGEAAL
jgi:hypothetical protein